MVKSNKAQPRGLQLQRTSKVAEDLWVLGMQQQKRAMEHGEHSTEVFTRHLHICAQARILSAIWKACTTPPERASRVHVPNSQRSGTYATNDRRAVILSNDMKTLSRVPIMLDSQNDEAQHSGNPLQIVALWSTARKRSAACSSESYRLLGTRAARQPRVLGDKGKYHRNVILAFKSGMNHLQMRRNSRCHTKDAFNNTHDFLAVAGGRAEGGRRWC